MQQLAPARRSGGLPQHGLVSLWDMYEFDASAWLKIVGVLSENAEIAKMSNKKDALEGNNKKATIINFKRIREQCEEIGLGTAAQLTRDMESAAKQGSYTYENLFDDMRMLKRTVAANMKAIKLMRIQQDYINYVEVALEDGIESKFPSSVLDFREAGAALAFGLGTASVFHLMRVMEVGLKAFGKRLGIPYAPSWESYLRQLDAKFSEKHKDKAPEWKRDEGYYREVAGDLQLIKLVWRNPTMHIVRSYSQSEARDIFNAVRAFMIRLSEKIEEFDENGTTS